MNAIDALVMEAIGKGWTLNSHRGDQAVLTHASTSSMDAAHHMICLALTFVTCGLWLPVWIAITMIAEFTSTPAQTLIIRLDSDGMVTQKVIRS